MFLLSSYLFVFISKILFFYTRASVFTRMRLTSYVQDRWSAAWCPLASCWSPLLQSFIQTVVIVTVIFLAPLSVTCCLSESAALFTHPAARLPAVTALPLFFGAVCVLLRELVLWEHHRRDALGALVASLERLITAIVWILRPASSLFLIDDISCPCFFRIISRQVFFISKS